MLYIGIGLAIAWLGITALIWCIVRSGSEHRKPTPPVGSKEFDLLELEKLWRTR